MKSARLLAAALLAAAPLFAACGKTGSDSRPPDSAAQPAAAADAAPAAAPETAAAVTSAPTEITEALVSAYMDYQKENLRLLREYAEKTRKNAESSRGDTATALQQMNLASQYSKEMDEKMAAKRRELGLSEEQFKAVREAAGEAATRRLLYNQGGGDKQLEAMAAEQKSTIEKLPEVERAAAQAKSDEMLKVFTDNRDLVELKAKYGDKAWDVLRRHADALAQQQLELLTVK